MNKSPAIISVGVGLAVLAGCGGGDPTAPDARAFKSGNTSPNYAIQITDLGGTGPALGLNRHGTVVGTNFTAAFAANEDGVVDLSLLGQPNFHRLEYATNINNSGSVVGWGLYINNLNRAFMLSPDQFVDIGTLPGGSSSIATDVNDRGQVVGSSSQAPPSGSHAFRWEAGLGMLDLGTLGGVLSSAEAVNELGQVVGWSYTSSGDTHAFLWTETDGMIDLGTLGGTYSVANDINDRGEVVGISRRADGMRRAFYWSDATGMIDVGAFGGSESTATAINNSSRVVGFSPFCCALQRPFVWTLDGSMIDLGLLPSDNFGLAYDINDENQVSGTSGFRSFPFVHQSAVLWEPQLP